MSRSRVLLVDNYDSFVGNLYQYLGELGAEPVIRRNDAVEPADVRDGCFTHLLISPGPKTPADAGVSVRMIREFAGRLPILGVCLGHQAIGVAYGARLVQAMRLVHGKTSDIRHDRKGFLAGLPSPFRATRYHSLALDRASLPEELEVTAETADGEVMAIRHREFAVLVEGVQFHPEAILTEFGKDLLANFLSAKPGAWFETILVRAGRPVFLEEHLARLEDAAGDPAVRDLAGECRELAAAEDGTARMRVTFAAGRREGAVFLEPFPGYPPEWYETGAVALLATVYGHPLGIDAGRKVWPYDRMKRLREEARAAGAADLVHLDRDGALLEGCGSNLFLVRDTTLLTPPTTRPILPGVTRAAVLSAASRLGIPTEERDVFPEDAAGADEAFLTGSLMEVLPLRRLGEIELAPGAIAARLLRAVRQVRTRLV